MKATNITKVTWAPYQCVDKKFWRAAAVRRFEVGGVSMFVTNTPGGYSVTNNTGARLTRATFSSIKKAIAFAEGVADDDEKLEALRNAGGRKVLSAEEILALPERKSTTETRCVASYVRSFMGESRYMVVAHALGAAVYKNGQHKGLLQRHPPKNSRARAVWGALQPNHYKLKDAVTGAIMFLDPKDPLREEVGRLVSERWPVWFDVDATALSAMGVFP